MKGVNSRESNSASDSASEYVASEQSDDDEELEDVPIEKGNEVAGNGDAVDVYVEDDDDFL